MYIARVAVELLNNIIGYNNHEWITIKTNDNITYYSRLREDLTYEFVAGYFSNPEDALIEAKTMYFNLLCTLYKKIRIFGNTGIGHCNPNVDNNEEYFYSSKKVCDDWGFGVYELDSVFEYDRCYKNKFKTTMDIYSEMDISVDNIADHNLRYDENLHKYFLFFEIIRHIPFEGIQNTMYCSLLEKIAGDDCEENLNKSELAIDLLNKLKSQVESSNLDDVEKNSIMGGLGALEKISSCQLCKRVAKKYLKDKKYGNYTTDKVVGDAYSARSNVSHNAKYDIQMKDSARYLEYLLLDLIIVMSGGKID